MREGTCLVVDVWEGQLEIDEAVLKAGGVAGIGIRLNDMNGGHHMDTGFEKQWREAAGFVRFPYFVYNPWVSGNQNYLWLEQHMPAGARSVAVDVEVQKNDISTTTYAAEFELFIERCKMRWKVIIYTAEWFLRFLARWPKADYWWAQYPSVENFFADVNTWEGVSKSLDELGLPFNGQKIPGRLKMWQFSGDCLQLPGTQRKIDLNLFYGSVKDLADYFGSPADETSPLPGLEPYTGLYVFSSRNFYARRGGGPLTLPLSRERKLGDNLLRLPWKTLEPSLKFINRGNSNAAGLISAPDWGPSKGLDGDEIRWLGLLWPGRNVVQVEEVVDGWGRVQGCPLEKAGTLDVFHHPHLVHEVYDYHPAAGYCERAKKVHVPILEGPWWVDLSSLVSVRGMLPKVVTIRAASGLHERAAPDSSSRSIGLLPYLNKVIILDVVVGRFGLWGQMPGNTWISLRHCGINYTDWVI